MNKTFLIVLLLCITSACHAEPNYTYTTGANDINILEQEKVTDTSNKINYSFHNNKCYVTIKGNNGRSIHVATPKLSNNKLLKLVNITF